MQNRLTVTLILGSTEDEVRIGLLFDSCYLITIITLIKLYHCITFINYYFIEKEILKSFLFIHFKPADQQIAIRGLESKINKFSKKSKNGECDELQLYGLANEFNQNKTSDKSIAITPEFIELIQNYPSVLYNSTTLKKFKKINMAKALKLEEDEYYKQDIFTQEIVNETI